MNNCENCTHKEMCRYCDEFDRIAGDTRTINIGTDSPIQVTIECTMHQRPTLKQDGFQYR